MAEATGGFGFAEKALLHLGELVRLEFLGTLHLLYRYAPSDFGILAEILDAHGPLAQFLFHLRAAAHRLLGAPAENECPAGVGLPAPENDGFRHLLGARQPRFEVAELRIVPGHVAKCGFGLVELALALEVEPKVVEVVHDGIVKGHLAEVVESHVELALPLESEAEHARVGRGLRVGYLLAALSDDEALGHEQDVAYDQQGEGQHELQPQSLAGHEHEVDGNQKRHDTGTEHGSHTGGKSREHRDQIDRDHEIDSPLDDPAPGSRDEKMPLQERGHRVRLKLDGRHRGIHGRYEQAADAGRRRTDQHDFVAILVHRKFTARDIVERIFLERRLAVAILVKIRE